MIKPLKIVTFNLRCAWSEDGANSFVHRAGLIWEKMRAEAPDVVALQEVMPKSLAILKLLMPDYEFFGQGRNADFGGEGLYTAVKQSAVSAVGFETFWIAPKPYEAESRFEDQSICPRICVAALLRHNATGQLFRVYNIHLDHQGSGARKQGIRCVLERIAQDRQKGSAPVVLLGDFNDTPESETIRLCASGKSVKLSDVTSKITCTFHNFGRDNSGIEKIDYIFLSEELLGNVISTSAWEDKVNGIYLSDHYPVCAELKLTTNE